MSPAGPWFAKTLLTGLLPIVCLAGLVWALHGPAAGWAAAALAFMLVVVVQTRRLAVLLAWLDSPGSAGFPDTGGAWGDVFLTLAQVASRRAHPRGGRGAPALLSRRHGRRP